MGKWPLHCFDSASAKLSMPGSDQRKIPLLEEQVSISKAEVITDHLRVSTHVEERPVLIEEVVERGDLQVERVAVERAVAEAPAPRQEGDTLIVSIVEERLVLEHLRSLVDFIERR